MPLTQKQRRRRVAKNERRTNQMMGGRNTFNSGAGDEKGDGRVVGEWRMENKDTDSLGYRITVDTWDKLATPAVQAGERPVLHLKLTRRNGRPLRLVILSENDFFALKEEAGEEDNE